MTARSASPFVEAPDWVVAEMPPGYQTRLLEIQRLSADLHAMEAIGRLLWETGQPLRDAVGAVFAALKCEVDATGGAGRPLAVKLDDSRRLLLRVAGAAGPIQKTSEELAYAFQAVQYASDRDRVVLVVSSDPATPPTERPDPVLPDALGVLQRMGVNVVTAATLFRLWRLSLEDSQKARKALERLHGQDGGPYVMPSR